MQICLIRYQKSRSMKIIRSRSGPPIRTEGRILVPLAHRLRVIWEFWIPFIIITGCLVSNILEYIRFTSAGITDIDDYAFQHVPNVTFLALDNNQLTIVWQHMLSGLIHLEMVHFEGNPIHTVEANSFKDSPALTMVSFHGNNLQTLPRSMFGVIKLDTFYLHNNPWQCDQRMCWIKQVRGWGGCAQSLEH